MSKKLYVGNLGYQVTEEDLSKSFSDVGECLSANVVRDKYSGQSRGFGFVEMANEEEAQEAITKLNDVEFFGRKMVVQEARPRREDRKGFSGRSGLGRRNRF